MDTTRIEKDLNFMISECLWAPSGDPDCSQLSVAITAYELLSYLNLNIKNKTELEDYLEEASKEYKLKFERH